MKYLNCEYEKIFCNFYEKDQITWDRSYSSNNEDDDGKSAIINYLVISFWRYIFFSFAYGEANKKIENVNIIKQIIFRIGYIRRRYYTP